jgi:hypothetical protein
MTNQRIEKLPSSGYTFLRSSQKPMPGDLSFEQKRTKGAAFLKDSNCEFFNAHKGLGIDTAKEERSNPRTAPTARRWVWA